MIFIASIRHAADISFLNYPVWMPFMHFENLLTSTWVKVLSLLTIVIVFQGIAIFILTKIASKQNDKQDRNVENGSFFQNAEYQYIPSYLGINILAFSLSEQLQYLIVLVVFSFFLINTKIIFFSPWLKVFKNYRLYTLNDGNKEELLILKGDNNEDDFQTKKLAKINTDVFIITQI